MLTHTAEENMTKETKFDHCNFTFTKYTIAVEMSTRALIRTDQSNTLEADTKIVLEYERWFSMERFQKLVPQSYANNDALKKGHRVR